MYSSHDKTFETVDRNCVSDKTVTRNFVSVNSHIDLVVWQLLTVPAIIIIIYTKYSHILASYILTFITCV